MKTGFHSPLPPAATGVADYAAALLKELQRHGDVEPHARRADIHLYHMGNNQLHRAVYLRALAEPGVVVVHDALLNHFYLGSLDESAYIDEFCHQYGDWHRDYAGLLWRERARSAADPRYFRFPMLKRIAGRARALVVHNPVAARVVRDHYANATVRLIPHLFEQPPLPDAVEVLSARARFGLTRQNYLFAVFGHLRESKRLHSILRALARARGADHRIALLVAGNFSSPDLQRALSQALDAGGIIRLPYLTEREFWLWASACDACINLRYPSAGETSGIGIRLMGIGKPVLVTRESGDAADAAQTSIAIEPGPAEAGHLAEWMRVLAANRGYGDQIGGSAQARILRDHSLARVGKLYQEVLKEARKR